MINDITRHTDDNIGGNFKFKFTPVNNIQSIAAISNGAIHTEIKLYAGSRWYEGYATPESMNFSDQQQSSEHGAFHKKTFKGVIPKNRPELIDLFNSMKDRRFILIVYDNNGLIRLVGNKTEPLKFTSSGDTKTKYSERNEFEFQFYGEGIDKSPFYNVDCPL